MSAASGWLLFLDVDGVVIDGWHTRAELRKPWTISLEADLGLPADGFNRAMFAPRADAPARMLDCLLGRRPLADALAEAFAELGYAGDVEDFIRYWLEHDSNVNNEVLAVARTLRGCGVNVYLATGQEHRRAAWLWGRLGFAEEFEALFYTARLGLAKRDPVFFQAIAAALTPHLDTPPLMVDDDPGVIDAARSAGWDGLVFNHVDDLRRHPRVAPLL